MQNAIRLSAGKRDPAIIEEMIGLVDKEKMQTIMSVGASYSSSSKNTVSMDMVDLYLRSWAEAKYDQFLLFGNKLTIYEEIELKMTNEQMRFEIDTLKGQYKQYALLLDLFRDGDFVKNSFTSFGRGAKNQDESYVLSMYQELFLKKGKKLSTALSEIIQDKGYEVERTLGNGEVVKSMHTFDIELSKIMQTKHINGRIAISINPTDFLMMSTNKHNWNSCMGLVPYCDGYNNVVLSKMIDEGSLIGYKCSDEEVEYDLCGFKFKYISMQARYLLFLDKTTGSCGIDGGHGGANANCEELREKVLQLLRSQITKYCDVSNDWAKNNARNYATDGLSYNDGLHMAYTHTPTIKKLKRQPYYDIGVKELICPKCGAIVNQRGHFICCK